MAGLVFRKKKCFEAGFEGVPRGFLSDRKEKVILCRGAEDKKGTDTNSGKSGMRNLEAESIRRRAERTGGCVKFKTVTEIQWILYLLSCSGLFGVFL